MEWSATHIGWDLQIILLWILLPPVFLTCAFLAFLAPLLEKRRQEAARRDVLAEKTLVSG
jgi:hypothetical protein